MPHWRKRVVNAVAGKKSHALCAEYDDLCAGSLFQEYEIDTIFDRPGRESCSSAGAGSPQSQVKCHRS